MSPDNVLILPGWQSSDAGHWQTLWEASHGYRRVEQHDWMRPLRGDWSARLDEVVVDAPGPGVLVVETTLTRLESSRPTMADYQREPGLGFESVYAGGAALSVRLSRDGSEVASLSDRYVGSFSDGTPRIGIWQDTDRAFTRWSRQLPSWVAQPETASR